MATETYKEFDGYVHSLVPRPIKNQNKPRCMWDTRFVCFRTQMMMDVFHIDLEHLKDMHALPSDELTAIMTTINACCSQCQLSQVRTEIFKLK